MGEMNISLEVRTLSEGEKLTTISRVQVSESSNDPELSAAGARIATKMVAVISHYHMRSSLLPAIHKREHVPEYVFGGRYGT